MDVPALIRPLRRTLPGQLRFQATRFPSQRFPSACRMQNVGRSQVRLNTSKTDPTPSGVSTSASSTSVNKAAPSIHNTAPAIPDSTHDVVASSGVNGLDPAVNKTTSEAAPIPHATPSVSKPNPVVNEAVPEAELRIETSSVVKQVSPAAEADPAGRETVPATGESKLVGNEATAEVNDAAFTASDETAVDDHLLLALNRATPTADEAIDTFSEVENELESEPFRAPTVPTPAKTSRPSPAPKAGIKENNTATNTPRMPRSLAALYLAPLRRQAEYGVPSCDLQLRSFSLPNLEFFCDFALRAAYYLGLPAYGPIPLPRMVERWTVPKASFIFKKSQENFERVTLRRLIQIKDGHPETVQIWLAFLQKHQYYGVGLKANVWEFSKLEVGKHMDAAAEEVEGALEEKWVHLGQHNSGPNDTVEKIEEFLIRERVKAETRGYGHD